MEDDILDVLNILRTNIPEDLIGIIVLLLIPPVTISRHGDLINCVYLQIEFPPVEFQPGDDGILFVNSIQHCAYKYLQQLKTQL